MQQNQKKNFTDLISGIVIMALAAFFYWTTFGIKSFLGTGRGRTSPDLIPKIVAVAMFVIGAVIVVQWLVRVKRGKVEPVVVQRETEESTGLNAQQLANRRLFQQITMPVTLVLIFCYIFAMSRIGFTLSTFAFLTFQITLLSTDLSA